MPGNFHNRFRFAMLGFAITVFFVGYQLVTNILPDSARDAPVMIGFVILCPPSLLSAFVMDAEVGTRAFYFVWALIAIANAALYGAVSAAIARRKKSLDSN